MKALRGVLVVLALAGCSSSSSSGGGGTLPPSNQTPPPEAPVAAEPAPTGPRDTSMCATREGGFGPVTLDEKQAAARHGQGITKYSAAKTTKEAPIEVCGVAMQQAWLLAATCDDGSPAFKSRDQVRDARRGNVGAGGRCETIIDLYVATCPEGEYELHVDMYHCGPDESFM